MDNKLKLIADSLGSNLCKFNEPISDYSVLKVGGPADLFFVATNQNEIIKIVDLCRQLKIPILIMGTGSKMMISDSGFRGVVVKNRSRNMKITSIKGKVSKVGIGVDEVMIEVDSGVGILTFVEFLNHQGLESEEFRGLTGSIGGNIFINKYLQDKAESVKVLNINSKIENISPRSLNLERHIILSVLFKIKAKG